MQSTSLVGYIKSFVPFLVDLIVTDEREYNTNVTENDGLRAGAFGRNLSQSQPCVYARIEKGF